MGDEIIHQTVNDVAERFEFRARLALWVIGVFGLIGCAAIATTAAKIDPALAVFIVGVACFVAATQMIIAWGAARGHSELARFSASGHELMHKLLAERLSDMEEIERQTGKSVVTFMDEFSRRRSGRDSG